MSRILSLTEFVDKTRWLLLKVHEKICQISGNSIKICRNKVIFAQPWPMIFTQIYNKSLPHFIFNSFLMFTHYETLLIILCCTSGIYLQFTSALVRLWSSFSDIKVDIENSHAAKNPHYIRLLTVNLQHQNANTKSQSVLYLLYIYSYYTREFWDTAEPVLMLQWHFICSQWN